MVKSIGNKKIKTAVFISGKGTNLRNLIKFSKLKKSPIKICLVFSSNRLAKGLNYAKKYLIKMKIYNFTNKKKAEFLILKDLKINRIDLICLAGFMKILSPDFIKKFKGKILNIHPPLLPKYKGLNTHARAIKNEDKYSGCTVHLVNAKLDSGEIILQKKIKIFKNDTVYKLKKRVQKQEYKLYPKAISKLYFNL